MNEGKQTFIELLVGVAFFGVLLIIPGLFWTTNKAAYYIGLMIGIIVAVFLAFDMYSSILKGLAKDEKAANSYFQKKVIVRLAIVIVVFFIAAYFKQISLLSVLFGALTLKFSAFLQPLTHKFLVKIDKGR